MESGLEFRVLGPLEVVRAGQPVRLGKGRESLLLACLLAETGRVVSADRLEEALWNGRRPRSASHALHVYVSRLRKALGDELIERVAEGYRLVSPSATIDAGQFEALLSQARATAARDLDAASQAYREALALWRGRAYGEHAFDDAVHAQADRLDELRLSALAERAEIDLTLGRHDELVAELQALSSLHPLHEPLHVLLMLALYRSGRQADALAAYEALHAALGEALGVTPGPEARSLHRAIVRQEGMLLIPGALPPVDTLPARASTFVGRGAELIALRDLILRDDVRLATLVGPPGVGKSRLAEETARTLGADYPDGVYLCELASIADPELVEASVAAALGAPTDPVNWIGDRHLLIVVDNFEHVLEAAPTVSRLLRACRRLDVVATSREPLLLEGEHVHTLDPLTDADATLLYVERAGAAGGDTTKDDALAVCRLLDGLPLSIELAASRAFDTAPSELVEALSDRLATLVAGRRDSDPRQTTLRATLDWSYELLDDATQRVYRALGAFAGGFTTAGAEAVAQASQGAIETLASKSLARIRDSSAGPRHEMLETIRQHAMEHLEAAGEAGEVHERHTTWLLKTIDELSGPARNHDAQAVAGLESEWANARAVLQRAVADEDAAVAQRVLAGLWHNWLSRGGAVEGDTWAARIIALPSPVAPERGFAHWHAAQFPRYRGEPDRAAELLRQAVDVFDQVGPRRALAAVHADLATSLADVGELDEAEAHARVAYAIREETGDRDRIGHALEALAWVAMRRGNFAEALDLNEAAVAGWNASGARLEAAEALAALGNAARHTGDVKRARAALGEAWSRAREGGDDHVVMLAVATLGLVRLDEGDLEQGLTLVAWARERSRLLGTDPPGIEDDLARAATLGTPEQRERAAALAAALTADDAHELGMGATSPPPNASD